MGFPRFERASLVGAFALFLVHTIGALHAQTSFPGCTDPDACNYNVAATVDDGTCIYAIVNGDCEGGGAACADGMYWNPILQKCLLAACTNCVGDLNGDASINVSDLLVFLGVFGQGCQDGGCLDETALNYNPEAGFNDGSCEFSPCGSSLPGDPCNDNNDLTYYDLVDSTACMCVGSPNVNQDGSGPCEGQSFLAYYEREYPLVEIGDQCWFQENLETYWYRNGDTIPNANWTSEGAHGVYGGYHQYNAYAVRDERDLCPSGWHVPSDEEFMDLELHLGLSEFEATNFGQRGSAVELGKRMKALYFNGNNQSGFDLLGSGYYSGSSNQAGNFNSEGALWTSSISSTSDGSSIRRTMGYNALGVNRFVEPAYVGQGVRCLKDEGCVSEGPVFDNPYFTDGEVQQISLSCDDGLQLDIAPYELTATDECDGEVLVTMSIDSYPLEVCGTGNLVTYSATNSQGQTATTSYTFEVVDVTGPVINAFANMLSINEPGFEWCSESSDPLPEVGDEGVFIDVYDECGNGQSFVHTYVDGPVEGVFCPGGYEFTRFHTVEAFDDCGNANSTTFTQTVIVYDVTPPNVWDVWLTFDCGAFDESALTSQVSNALGLDACESVSLTNTGYNPTCGWGAFDLVYTAVATDACDNTSTAEVVVQVQDNTAPYLYVYNQDIVVDCSASESDIFNSVYFETFDDCSDVTVSMEVVPMYDECGLLSGGSYVLVTATDACGNQSSAQVNVQQMDTNPPTIAIPDVAMECDGAGNVNEINAWIASHGGAFVDDCCDVVWSHSVLSNTANAGCGGNVVVNFTATDAFGNSSTSTAVAFIVDNTPPNLTLSQEPEMYVFSDPDPFGWCGTPNVDFVFPVGEPLAGVFVYASDNCSDVTYSHSYVDSNPQSTGCGADYTFIRTHILVAEDACGNLTSESIDQVVQVDYELPDFSELGLTMWDVTISCNDSPDLSVFVDEIQNALPSCSNYSVSSELLSTSYLGCYEAQYDFQVTIADGCGWTTSIAGVIHSIDNVPPEITITDGLSNGDTLVTCEGTLPPMAQVIGTDICSEVTIVYSEESEPYSDNGQGVSGVLYTRSYTLSDCVGNETQFTYYVDEVDECFCPFNSPPDYHFTVETVMNHREGELAGQTTYRVYLNGVSPLDYLSACGGDGLDPLILQSTSGSWYNSPYNGSWNASGVNPAFFSVIPELAFDSYVTIGAGDNLQEPQIHPSLLDNNDELLNEFDEDGPGLNLTHDGVGIVWFSPFPGIENPSHPAFFGDDLMVLVAQFTTAGEVYGQMSVQVFPNGDQGQDFQSTLPFPHCGSPLNP
jgi:uncharacterized protein (TIGR02145 family)